MGELGELMVGELMVAAAGTPREQEATVSLAVARRIAVRGGCLLARAVVTDQLLDEAMEREAGTGVPGPFVAELNEGRLRYGHMGSLFGARLQTVHDYRTPVGEFPIDEMWSLDENDRVQRRVVFDDLAYLA